MVAAPEDSGELRLRKLADKNGTPDMHDDAESTSEIVRRMNKEAQKEDSDKSRRTYGRTPEGTSMLYLFDSFKTTS
jgi:hypothetical protein